MFNLQGSEIIIILVLALVVLGPEKLPGAMRKAGQLYAELKKMSSGFQDEFRAALEEPVKEVRDTANMLRDSADFTKLQEGERGEKPKSATVPVVSDDADDGSDVTAGEPAGRADPRPRVTPAPSPPLGPFSGTTTLGPAGSPSGAPPPPEASGTPVPPPPSDGAPDPAWAPPSGAPRPNQPGSGIEPAEDSTE